MKFLSLLSLLSVLFLSSVIEARVFDLKRESFGSYLQFSASQSNLKDTVFVGESAATEFTEEYQYPTGGEFGFMYTNPYMGMRFGFEIIKPLAVTGEAKLGGQKVYTYANDLSVMAPKVALDIHFKTGSFYRLSATGFYGSATMQGKTDYSGISGVLPTDDHSVEMKASSAMFGGGLVAEISAFDTTTLSLEAGYRQLKFANVSYAKDVTTFTGSYVQGDTVKTMEDEDRVIDLTGAYVALGFKFYLF